VIERDDLPIFRPRMGRGPKRASRDGAGSFRSALLSRITRGARVTLRRAARSRVAVGRPDASARRVVVKAHVARLGAGGAKAAALHLRYIERDGVEKDGSKGVPFTADGPARVETFDQPRPGERSISPDRVAGRRQGARPHRICSALDGARRARSRSQARVAGGQSLRYRPSSRPPGDPRR
jgi:hypothetical protein